MLTFTGLLTKETKEIIFEHYRANHSQLTLRLKKTEVEKILPAVQNELIWNKVKKFVSTQVRGKLKVPAQSFSFEQTEAIMNIFGAGTKIEQAKVERMLQNYESLFDGIKNTKAFRVKVRKMRDRCLETGIRAPPLFHGLVEVGEAKTFSLRKKWYSAIFHALYHLDVFRNVFLKTQLEGQKTLEDLRLYRSIYKFMESPDSLAVYNILVRQVTEHSQLKQAVEARGFLLVSFDSRVCISLILLVLFFSRAF